VTDTYEHKTAVDMYREIIHRAGRPIQHETR
jgi:hypothetical protein